MADNSGNNNNKNGKNNKNSNLRGVLTLIAWALVLTVAFNYFNAYNHNTANKTTSHEIKYSEMIDMVEKNQVEEILFKDSTIYVTPVEGYVYTEEVTSGGKTEEKSYKQTEDGSLTLYTAYLSNSELLPLLKEHKVAYTGYYEAEMNPILLLMINYILPVIIMVGLFMLLMRLMSKSGGGGFGGIAAGIGFKNTTTGDTLCDEKHPIILESMEFPDPVIRVAIEPKTKAGQEKMGIALAKLAEEDPTFKTYTDEETGQTIIAGMGELHLEIIVDRLLREFKVEANVGSPQVAYKETIRRSADVDQKYARQSGGKGQYGHVKIIVEPNESGKGYEFINKIVGGAIPKEYIEPVNQGIQGAMQAGILAGYPVVDVKVTLYDGSYHEVDSSEMAFKIAGSMAFKEAMKKADPVLMEPIMQVDVLVPEEYMGDVIGDLNSRRGQIQGMEPRGGVQAISAAVPLSEMFGYATTLRSRTQGRGQYTMQPSHYTEVPKSIQEKIIDSRTKNND